MHLPSLDNWKTSLVQATGNSPLGEITLGGTISKSRGIRHDKPRVFGQWAIVYLVEGAGRYHDARGTDIPLRAGDVILVFPEVAHSYGPEPGGIWNELYVCFRGPIFEAWRKAGCLDPLRPTGRWLPPAKGVKVFQKFFREIQGKNFSALKVTCLWQELLGEIVGSGDTIIRSLFDFWNVAQASRLKIGICSSHVGCLTFRRVG